MSLYELSGNIYGLTETKSCLSLYRECQEVWWARNHCAQGTSRSMRRNQSLIRCSKHPGVCSTSRTIWAVEHEHPVHDLQRRAMAMKLLLCTSWNYELLDSSRGSAFGRGDKMSVIRHLGHDEGLRFRMNTRAPRRSNQSTYKRTPNWTRLFSVFREPLMSVLGLV